MMEALNGIIASKKWIGVLLAIVVAVLAQYGVISEDLAHTIEIALGIGVSAQAVADHGKEAAKIAAKGTTTLLLLLVVLFTLPACGATTKLMHDLKTCAKANVKQLSTELMPAVEAVLLGDMPSWRGQLDALVSFAGDSGVCAVSAAYDDFSARLTTPAGAPHASPQEVVGARNARAYLKDLGL